MRIVGNICLLKINISSHQFEDCKCNGWKNPIQPASSTNVTSQSDSQLSASPSDPCRSCGHNLGWL